MQEYPILVESNCLAFWNTNDISMVLPVSKVWSLYLSTVVLSIWMLPLLVARRRDEQLKDILSTQQIIYTTQLNWFIVLTDFSYTPLASLLFFHLAYIFKYLRIIGVFILTWIIHFCVATLLWFVRL